MMASPRQQDLPGMSERKLKDLHDAALDYVEARDNRIAASTPEVQAKQSLLMLMKKHKLEHYKFDNVEIDITHEKEKVTVRIYTSDVQLEPPAPPPVDGKMRAANDDMPTMPATNRKAVAAIKKKKR